MRILTISDYAVKELYERFDRHVVGAVDLILACGDLPPEYLSFLRDRLDAPLYFVLGNHDIRYRESPPQGCVDIGGRLVVEQGLRILGLPGSRWYNGGPNQYTEKDMQKIIRNLSLSLWRKKGVDIVISHSPPRGLGDRDDPCHKGFRSFLDLVEKQRPAWFIHGHIHALFNMDAERIIKYNGTKICNTYGYHVLDIESD